MVGLESLTDSGAEISHADEPRRRRVVHRRFLNSSSVVVVVFVELSTPSTKTSFHLNRKRHRRQRLFVSDNCFDAESSKDFFCAIATEETEAASLGRLNRGLSLAASRRGRRRRRRRQRRCTADKQTYFLLQGRGRWNKERKLRVEQKQNSFFSGWKVGGEQCEIVVCNGWFIFRQKIELPWVSLKRSLFFLLDRQQQQQQQQHRERDRGREGEQLVAVVLVAVGSAATRLISHK